MQAAGGAYSPLPVDQAIAYMVEVLPAFSYLHTAGPAVLRLQAGQRDPGRRQRQADRPRRRAADRRRRSRRSTAPSASRRPRCHATAHRSPATSTPSGARWPCWSSSSAGYRASTSTTCRRPSRCRSSPSTTRCTGCSLKATAPAPEDRFQSADELREQLLGVLREVTSRQRRRLSARVRRRRSSRRRRSPATSSAGPTCRRLRPDASDPMASWLSGVTSDDPARLLAAPRRRPGADGRPCAWPAARGRSASATSQPAPRPSATRCSEADPWDWRAVWMNGLAALAAGDVPARCRRSTPSTARCPASWRRSWRWPGPASWPASARSPARLYAVCARTDGAYLAPAQFGLARLAAAGGRRDDALAALDRIPPVEPGVRRVAPPAGVAARRRRVGDARRPRRGVGRGRSGRRSTPRERSGAADRRSSTPRWPRRRPTAPQPRRRSSAGADDRADAARRPSSRRTGRRLA